MIFSLRGSFLSEHSKEKEVFFRILLQMHLYDDKRVRWDLRVMLDCALKMRTINSRGKAKIWGLPCWLSDGMTKVSPTGIMAT